MKENEKTLDKFDSMPFIALIHHISKNKLRYAQKNPNHIDMVHEGRYLMEIHYFWPKQRNNSESFEKIGR